MPRRERPSRPRAPASLARGRRCADRRPRSSGGRAVRVGRSHGLGYNEPTGLEGSVGERARGHLVPPSPASQDRYASLTGPAMKGRGQRSIPGARTVAPTGTGTARAPPRPSPLVTALRRPVEPAGPSGLDDLPHVVDAVGVAGHRVVVEEIERQAVVRDLRLAVVGALDRAELAGDAGARGGRRAVG